MGKLEKKVAVITGAASGIGRATAIRFAGEGAAVVIADLNREGGDAAVRDCKENGGNAVFQLTDVSSEENIKSAVDRAVKEFGRLDIIYNNAGLGGAVGPLEKTSAENWDRSFSILLRAVFLGIKHAVPEMRKTGGGSIISTASIAGLRGARRTARILRRQGRSDQPDPLGFDRTGQGQDSRQLHLSRTDRDAADLQSHSGRRTSRDATLCRLPAVAARGTSRRYCGDGAIPRQRRLGIRQRAGDGG